MRKGPTFMNFTRLNLGKARELVDSLSKDYGCDLDFLKKYKFYITSKDKVLISKVDIEDLDLERVNSIGMYFGTYHDDKRFRLSLEGSKFVNPSKNFVKISDEKVLSGYLAAENLFVDEIEMINCDGSCPFLIVQYKEDNLGCVSHREKELLTYMPKSRKLDYNKVF